MPLKRSAIKRAKQNIKRHQRNVAIKSRIKTLMSRVDKAKNGEEAQKTLIKAVSALDKAAQKGVIRKNTASRKKSRLTRKVNALSQSKAQG
jgi:small subunit ribosomal protein S20